MKKKNFDILLIEDNPGDARLIEEYLTGKGDDEFSINHVQSLHKATSYLEERDVDIVLLDLGLPDSQGLDTFYTLKSYVSDIPVLIMTGLDDEELALEIVQAGAQDYLVKDHIDEFSLPRVVRYAFERERAQKDLQESEKRYRAVVENSHDGILVVGENYKFEYVNDRLCELLGVERNEILGNDFRNYLDEPSQKLVGERYVKRQRGEQVPPRYEFNIIRKDGKKRRVEISSTIIRDSQGKVKTIAQIKDITERKRAESALEKSEARYRRIFNTTPVSIWEEDFSGVHHVLKDLESQGVTDLRTYLNEHPAFIDQAMQMIKVKDVNAQTLKMFEAKSKEELLGSLDKVTIPQTREILREELLAIHEGKSFFEGETVNQTLQGEKLHVLLNMAIPPKGEELDSILVTMMDITERKKMEEALAEREKKFRTLFNNANDAMYLHELTEEGMPGRFIEVNDVACDMLGYTREEFMAMSPRDIDDPDAASAVPEIMRDLLEQGDLTFEMQHVSKEGRKVPVEVSSHLFSLNGDRVVLSIARDITERKEAEKALRESEEKYRRFFQTSQDCVFITTRDGQWLEMNQAAVELFGYENKEELAEVNVRDLYADPAKRHLHLQEIEKKGFSKDYPVDLRKKNGSIIHTRISSTLYYQAGEHIGYQGTIRDITELVRYIEEIKRQSNQLNALREVGLDLVSELDVDELLKDVVTHAVELVNGVGGSFNILDPERQVLEFGVHIGYESFPEDTTIKKGEGLIGQVWATREKVLVEDYAAWEGHAPQWVDHIGHRAMIGIPVVWGQEMLGALEIMREPGELFSAEEAQLLEMFANQAAAAIRNAKIIDHAEQRLSRLQSLRQIDQTISGSLDLKTTLDVLIDRLIQNLEVDAGTILLYRPPLHTLEYVTGSGFRSEALRQTKLRIGEGQAGRAVLERRIIHIPDLTLETVRFERAKLIRQEDFVAYFGVPLIAKGEIVGVLEVFHRNPLDPSPEWIDFLKTLAGQAAIAIDRLNLFNDLQRSNLDLIRAYNEVIEGWARALELRDQETEGHSRRVEKLTLSIARKMGIDEEELAHVRQGALLHDIGKMGVPDQILQKKGKLTEEEWEVMKKHPTFAYELLSPIDHLKPALDIPYCHHEKWDGSGYPQGLEGEEIPLAARIFAVVDVWDALRSDRPYREAWSDEEALAYIKEQSGKHFDPQVVQIFLNIIQEWDASDFNDKIDNSN